MAAPSLPQGEIDRRPLPSRLAARGAAFAMAPLAGRERPAADSRYDGSKLLCVYLALLILIPSTMVVPGLGAAGSPAMLFGLVLFVRWLVASIQGTTPGRSAMRWALLVFTIAVLASYIAAQLRALQTLEVNSADRGLIRLIGWAGVLLTALDGLPNRAAFRRVLVAASLGGVFLAVVGLWQASTGFDLAAYIHIPGLRANNLDGTLPPELRNGIPRLQATTSHPIEFSTVLVLLIALVAPLALRHKATKDARWWFAALLVMGLAFPQAVARSGFLAAGVLALVVIPLLPSRPRQRVLIALPFGIVAVHFLFPSLLGTIFHMFQYTADGQEVARTSDYGVVLDYFGQAPVFGRGFGTMINTLYRTLDNQFLGMLQDSGLFGLFAFIGLHATAMAVAARGRRLAPTVDDRLLGAFLIGAPLAALVSSITFDSLSFPMFAGILFLILGLCGAYARLMTDAAEAKVAKRPGPRRDPHLRLRGSAIAIIGALCLISVVRVHSAAPVWFSSRAVVVSPAKLAPLQGSVSTGTVAAILTTSIDSDQVRDELRQAGHLAQYDVAQGSGSLETGTDVTGDGPVLHIQAQSSDPGQAESTAKAVVAELNDTLAALQNDAKVSTRIRAELTTPKGSFTPEPVSTGGRRAEAAILLLGFALSLVSWTMLGKLADRRRDRRHGSDETTESDAPREGVRRARSRSSLRQA